MDKLEEIFSMQAILDEKIRAREGMESFTTEQWIQKKCLAMIDEISEVLNEVNYKWWKKPTQIQSDKLKEELIDVLHFLISMCLDSGMSAEEMYAIYMNKNKENHARQDGKSQKTGY